MKTIDLCIISTLRPEILKQTLSSFGSKVKFNGKTNIRINVDLVPQFDFISIITNVTEIAYFIGNFNAHGGEATFVFGKGNFSKAVKTVWENSISDYVFHLEDDWAFAKEINLNDCIERMESEGFDYMRFPKIHAPHLNCLHKVALQPSLWKGDVVRALAKHMRIDKDPEKQLRTGQGNEPLDKILFEIQRKGLKDYCKEWCCKDIGREWREERGLIKWNKNKDNKDITWQNHG